MTILVFLRFALAETADLSDFEGDLRAMKELAQDRRGYVWSEIGPAMGEPRVYLAVSEWDGIGDVRSWEHDPVHEQVQRKWKPHFREPLVHSRWIPWVRTPDERRLSGSKTRFRRD